MTALFSPREPRTPMGLAERRRSGLPLVENPSCGAPIFQNCYIYIYPLFIASV